MKRKGRASVLLFFDHHYYESAKHYSSSSQQYMQTSVWNFYFSSIGFTSTGTCSNAGTVGV